MINAIFNKPKLRLSKGFSLIELMVVMAIMTILMGLTGALVTNTVTQQERQVEIEKTLQLFKRLSYQAFYQGTAIEVQLKENKILIFNRDQKQTLTFKQLTFVEQKYKISTQAVIMPNQFSVFWNDKIRNFPFKTLFTTYDVSINE